MALSTETMVIDSDTCRPEPIAICGIGCRLPGGANSAQSFWELLRDGQDAIGDIPADRWDLSLHFDADAQKPLHQHVRRGGFIDGIDQFDPAFFGISPREAVCMDPQQRLLLEVAWQAIEDAGQPLETIRGQNVAVFIGISSADYSSLLWLSEEDYAIPDNEPFVLPGNTGCIAANRLSYFFDFKGPSLSVDTACSSSLVAVHLACESIWRGEASAALAGGVQALIHPGIQSSFCKAGLLAPDGRCKSFDAAADGYVRSEGAGVVLLKPLAAAQADGDTIYALIHGTAVNSDGRSNGMVAPNMRAQIACVRAAFERAGIAPAATQYVEAHGTGTRQGDPIELRALGTVLGEGRDESRPCRVGSVKTNLGHSETAAGITGLIKAALCVHHRQIPPSLHFRSPNPSIDFQGLKMQVQTQLEAFPQAEAPAVVGVSSFGFGGTNAHVVLADAPPRPPVSRYGQQLPLQLLTLSARSETGLQQQAAQMAAYLRSHPRTGWTDVCGTANQCRSQLVRRLICLAPDRARLLEQLTAVAAGGQSDGVVLGQASRRPGKLAFLFTGQGSQAIGMARGLHQQHPVFRQAFEQCTAILDPLLERPLAEVLFPAAGDEQEAAQRLNQTGFTQPALFVVGYALSQLWLSWGVKPDLLLGHSVGEVVAAHLAGVFSLEEALRLIAARGRLMQALPAGGGMVALLADRSQVEALLAQVATAGHEELELAALNGPTNLVVSGSLAAVEALERQAGVAGVKAHRLTVSHAFHSPAMAPMLAAFEQELAGIRFTAPTRPLISNLSGRLAGPEIATSHYWCEHVISPVRFAEGMAAAASQGVGTFVELGARPTLIGMGRQCLKDPNLAWWPSLRPGQDDLAVILTSLAELHRSGHPVDWRGFHRPFPHGRVPLPAYPFQRQRYWWSRRGEGETPSSLWRTYLTGAIATDTDPLPSPAPTAAAVAAAGARGSAGSLQLLALPGGSEQRYTTWLSAQEPADLSDHRIRTHVVFPAAGFIELALQVLQQQGRPLVLAELELDQPLRLEQGPSQLQLVVGERLEFHSSAPGSERWRCHGQVQGSQVQGPPPLVPAACPAGAGELALEGFYGALARFGLSYGPHFRALTSVRRLESSGDAETRAWATVQRPAGARDWALIDACFQAVAATLDPEAAAGQLFLPVGFAELRLQHLPLPDRFHCQVQLRHSEEPAFVLADLLLLGDEASSAGPIGWVKGFRLRRLPRQALDWLFPLEADAAAPAQEQRLVRARWLPVPPAEPLPGLAPTLQSAPAAAESPPLGPRILWPDLPAADLETTLADLLATAQQAAPSEVIWLVLEGDGAAQGALEAFVRAAALERATVTWFTLRLPAGAKAKGLAIPWTRIAALAASEPAIRFDGEQLFQQRLIPLAAARFRITTASFGLLESLQHSPLPPQEPAPGEVEIAVEATGLNFRDVLNALGLLRSYSRQLGLDAAAQVPFGGECVGRVVAVGAGVPPERLGQRVLAALAVGSLASHVLCRSELCLPLPEAISPEVGASLSTAFLTAIHGLETLAHLQPGETVLIHAAAGGVGQAAIQVARRRGARVLATASATKQAALLNQGVEAVFDSRSLEFADQVLAATDGRGVDVVLNSLKGDWVDASFRALAQGGRFVELGKIDIWSRAEANTRRPDAAYLPFDLLEVAAADAASLQGQLQQVLEEIATGVYQPLPLQVYPIEQTVEAFRLLAQARHVGKVVIRQPERRGASGLDPQGTYLITGAFGSLGGQLARWLAEQGARSLLLLGRTPPEPNSPGQALVDDLRAKGVACITLGIDLAAPLQAGDPETGRLAAALAALPAQRPLRGIVHAAGILDDGLIGQQTPARLAAVLAPKLGGWQRLEAALALTGLDPDLVVHFSSMASLLGSPGQAGYCAANGALDALAEKAQRPGWISIQWGPWSGAGMAGGLEQQQRQRLETLGVRLLEPDQALELLGNLIARGEAGAIAALDVDWQRLARQAGARQGAALQQLATWSAAPTPTSDNGLPAYVQELAGIPPAERPGRLQEFVQRQLAKVMGIDDPAQIDPGEPLFNIGLDSLMALELMVLLEKNLGITLTESLVFDYPTIEELSRYFLAELFPMATGTGSAQAAQVETGVQDIPGELEATNSNPGEQVQEDEPAAIMNAWSEQAEQIAKLDSAALLRQIRGEDG